MENNLENIEEHDSSGDDDNIVEQGDLLTDTLESSMSCSSDEIDNESSFDETDESDSNVSIFQFPEQTSVHRGRFICLFFVSFL